MEHGAIVPDAFDEIRRAFSALVDSGALNVALAGWREQDAAIGLIADASDLVAMFANGSGFDRDLQDEIVVALCRLAVQDERAGLVLLGFFMPGLLNVHAQLRHQTYLPPEDLIAEIVFGFWQGVRAIRQGDSRVGKRLLNSARWHALDELERAKRDRVGTETIMSGVETQSRAAHRSQTLPFDDPVALLDLAVRQGVISQIQRELLCAPRGSLGDAATSVGLTPRTALKHRAVAKKRLRAWVALRITGASDRN